MANIWEKSISILAGNLNSGLSYLITTVIAYLMNAISCCVKILVKKLTTDIIADFSSFNSSDVESMWSKTKSYVSL